MMTIDNYYSRLKIQFKMMYIIIPKRYTSTDYNSLIIILQFN